ncbi:MAG: hypothetical protein EOP00_22265 [Pedobacter sp.]|nr:MAG: hypothetical protein EOP00_22265 [Pedobacter sp.]
MRNSYKILLGGLLLFVIITWATASLQYNADGADEYGFPFNFYTKVSGYDIVTNEGATSTRFSFLGLLGDVTFAFAASWLFITVINKFNKKANV